MRKGMRIGRGLGIGLLLVGALSAAGASAALTGHWVGTWSDTLRVGRVELTFTPAGQVSGFFEDYLALYRAGATGTYNFQVSGTYTHDGQSGRMTFTTHGTSSLNGHWDYYAWGEATVTGDTLNGPHELNVAVHVDGMTHTIRGRSWAMQVQAVPLPPINPDPPDGTTDVADFAGLLLQWEDGGLSNAFDVFLATHPDLGADDRIAEGVTQRAVPAGPLTENTTYYWRVEAINGTGRTAGPVWQFSTVALTEPATDVTMLDFGTGADQLELSVWNKRSTPMSYRLGIVAGGQYFSVGDPNAGVSMGPQDPRIHVVRVHRDALTPGVGVTGQLVINASYAAAGPVYVTLRATGTDARADLDISGVYHASVGQDAFFASSQTLAEEWTLELTNANPATGPTWGVKGVDFAGAGPFVEHVPEPNAVDGATCTWGSAVLEPGQWCRFVAIAEGVERFGHVPVSVSRSINRDVILDGDEVTTTVTVTPDRSLEALDVQITLSTELVEPLGPLQAVAWVSQDANSCSASPSGVRHESGPGFDRMTWRFGPVGATPITFTVTHRLGLDTRCLWLYVRPAVVVRAVPVGSGQTVLWRQNVAVVPGRGTVRVRGDSAVNGHGEPDLAEWTGVRLGRVLEHSALTDQTGDGVAGLGDLRVLVEHWLAPCDPNHPGCDGLDFNADGRVDLLDLAIMAGEWNVGSPPAEGDSMDSEGSPQSRAAPPRLLEQAFRGADAIRSRFVNWRVATVRVNPYNRC